MRVESYFADVRKTIEQSLIVRLSNISYEKRGTHEGIIRHKHLGRDGSVVPADPMDLGSVLREIEVIVELP